ncbi:HAD family phosphatase [Candidatus Micrarchaeota archaeon]|nr:HAD family phosphatase [Candidatus Micrarchaeota archaeon]
MKAVIFDVDGVLVNSEGWHCQAWNQILKPYDIQINKEEYAGKLAGRQGEDIDKDFITEHDLKIPFGKLITTKEALILEWMKTKEIPLMFYSKEILENLRKNKKLIGAASSSPADELEVKLKRSGFWNYFSAVTSKDEIKHSKPSPDIYLLEAKKLGIDPKQAIACEDSSYGVIAAKRAGMKAIAIPNEWSNKQDFSQADYVVKNLQEAYMILEKELD